MWPPFLEQSEVEVDSWYFAYGSNLDPSRKEQRTGNIRRARRARLPGYRFAFSKKGDDGTGKANLVPDEQGEVWGVAYLSSPEALQGLDRLEGVPNHYVRQPVSVLLDTGDTLDAITYVAHPDRVTEGMKPSSGYLQYILKGARHHGLPETYVKTIEELA